MHAPTSASAIAPGTPPTRTKRRTSGPVAITLPSSTGLRPNRSARGPNRSVPTPPEKSIRASRWFPCDFECPSDTSHSGTKAIRVNHATLRSAITPSSSFIAQRSSAPWCARATVASGANPRKYGVVARIATATARLGTASTSPPRSPSAVTTAVAATGPSA